MAAGRPVRSASNSRAFVYLNHHNEADLGTSRLTWAVAINMLLTAAQVIGGVVSSSLSLIADALHNFSDAAGLLLAMIARRISKRPADKQRTFGYGRAEVVMRHSTVQNAS